MSQQINLFNPIFLKKKRYFSAVTMAQALGLIFVGTAVLGAYTNFRLSQLGKEAETTTAQLTAVQAQVNKVDAQYGPREKSKSLEEEVQNAEAAVKALQQVFAVMEKGDFGNTQGYAEYMQAFARQIVSGVWLTGFSIYGAGSDISLQGRALKPDLVAAYITRLKRESILQGKSFSALEMQAPLAIRSAKSDPATSKQQTAAGYIGFSLRSSGATTDQAVPAGATKQ
jgi:Tfp pilus assembly protein PilN